MTGQLIIQTVIDTDNALGSANQKFLGGDVDDAFALAFLLKSQLPLATIYSVAGNASSSICQANNKELCKLLNAKVSCIEGHSGLGAPPNGSNYLALGPLTNLAHFIKNGYIPNTVWMTLGRQTTYGNFPPFWPIEFNATKDLSATSLVLSADINKFVVPLDVAFKLKTPKNIKSKLIVSDAGSYLWHHMRRWQWRSLLLKGRMQFPVWDLVSAIAQVYPECVKIENGMGYLFKNGLFLCDVANKKISYHSRERACVSTEIKIVTEIDSKRIWDLFFKVLQGL